MRKARLFLAYSPLLLVSFQVLINLLSFVWKDAYYSYSFYWNLLFGNNMIYSISMLILTYTGSFCKISRAAAFAEVLFAFNYLIVQQDNLYNIIFQIIVGIVAIIYTIGHYANKFPLCKLGLFVSFVKSVINTRSCSKGLVDWDDKVKKLIVERHERKF